ncbi:4168_t:CDS:1, partial [Funneliformis geosporum]
MNRNQPLFIRNDGKYFITNEDAKKWDQEQYNPEETRLPTLMELEKEDRLANEKVIENLSPEKRQEYE